jgi:hypothetical protein
MARLAFLFTLAALTLSVAAASASAQQAGGESLAPEVMNTPGAAEAIRERTFARLQMLQIMQQLRAGGVPSAAATAGNPNAVNSALDRSSVLQDMLARIPPRGGRVRPQVAADSAPTFVDQSQTLVLNTAGGPVSVGNDNVVQQQVSTSTAISQGAGSVAGSTASAANDTAAFGRRHGKAGGGASAAPATSQSATSTAVSVGGTAVATAANSNVVSRGDAAAATSR